MNKIDLDTYMTHNSICESAEIRSGIVKISLRNVRGHKPCHYLTFPLETEVMVDLFKIFDAESLDEFVGKPCRYLVIDWKAPLVGVAHFMRDLCITYAKYWHNGDPKEGRIDQAPMDGEMFTMATIDPPPGLPWRLRETGGHMATNGGRAAYDLLDNDGQTIAEKLNYDVAMWLTKKAKLATLDKPK